MATYNSLPEFGIYEVDGQQYMKRLTVTGLHACGRCAFVSTTGCNAAPCGVGYFIRLEVDDAHGEQQHS